MGVADSSPGSASGAPNITRSLSFQGFSAAARHPRLRPEPSGLERNGTTRQLAVTPTWGSIIPPFQDCFRVAPPRQAE